MVAHEIAALLVTYMPFTLGGGMPLEAPYNPPPKKESPVIRHMSDRQLKQALDSHNANMVGRGVSCQCNECLYNRWYWKTQYNTEYPELPYWLLNK